MNSMWKRRIAQVRKRWWVVLAVTVLGLSAAAASIAVTQPTYVGKSTLMLSGQAPDQDAVMMLGYQTIFRDPATIPRLRANTTIPGDVTFEAQTVASSPILTIEATAGDPVTAQSAARDMAVAFSEDINAVQKAGVKDDVAGLQRQLDSIPRLDPNGATNPYYASLQERIDAARGNLSSQLLGLQPEAGVTENLPNVPSMLARGALGGLVLGILAALGLAALSTSLTSLDDVRDKTTVTPLVEVPRSGPSRFEAVRRERLRTLVNLISLESLPKPTTIALTGVNGTHGSRSIAIELARTLAQRGGRIVLVYADNAPAQDAAEVGFNDVLAGTSTARDALTDGDVASLQVMPAGSTVADRYPLATRERIAAVFDEITADADLVIVAAPSMIDVTESQIFCAASDATILVLDRGARAGVVGPAVETLERNAHVLGAVLIDRSEGRGRGQRATPVPEVTAHAEAEEIVEADEDDEVVEVDEDPGGDEAHAGVIAFSTATAPHSAPERDHA